MEENKNKKLLTKKILRKDLLDVNILFFIGDIVALRNDLDDIISTHLKNYKTLFFKEHDYLGSKYYVLYGTILESDEEYNIRIEEKKA